MKSYSQAGQDVFVRLVLGNKPGTFLDIGCAGDQYSNTKALEEEGWTGWLVDFDLYAGRGRSSRFYNLDVTKPFKLPLPSHIDYLSLDVDENSLAALKNLPLDKTRFWVITIEHDQYRFGDKLYPEERAILMAHGYQLICKDVCGAPGAPFEDWFCSLELANRAAKFCCEGKLYSEILKGHL